MASTELSHFASKNPGMIYPNIDVLQDDYLRLLDHMRTTGETAVPLPVFRSFCESYAQFMRTASTGSNEEYSSAQGKDLEGILDDEDGEIPEEGEINTDGEILANDLMMQRALAVDEAKETPSQTSAMQEHSDPDEAITHNSFENHSSTHVVDKYEVVMCGVRVFSMDLSNPQAKLQVAQELIRSNDMAHLSSQTTDQILYLHWVKQNLKNKEKSSVCIGFTRLELANKAFNEGIQWAGEHHNCAPRARAHKLKYCINCLSYDHRQPQCKNTQRCSRCGSEHSRQQCTSTDRKCATCGGNHTSQSPKCPQYVIQLMKAGLWPSRAKVVKRSASKTDKAIAKLEQRNTIQSQSQPDVHQSPASQSTLNDISMEIDVLPNPSDSKRILEHLDRLRTLVLASSPALSTSTAHRRKKRKARAPIDPVSTDSIEANPKRLKEEVAIKQEKQENELAQREQLYYT